VAPKVFLSDEVCSRAVVKLAELLETHDKAGVLVQERAAKTIITACQNQERFNLRPQNEADYQRALKAGSEGAKTLEEMTPEELLRYQKQMLGESYPGKPA
jgi:hypothetical protein